MSEQSWLSGEQIERLAPHFPRSRGKARVDDRRVLSGIIHIQRNGCADAMTLRSTAHTRRCTTGTFAGPATACLPASSPYWRRRLDHRSGSSSTARASRHTGRPRACCKKRGPRQIGYTQGGLNSKLHAVCDRHARPLVLLLSQLQMSDHKGAGLLIDALPPARVLVADRGYDSGGFRTDLEDLGKKPCIPSRKNRKHPHPHDPALYRQRHPIENLFAKLKDWRRIATRYDRCADIFMGAITLAAIGIFWLGE